jgi:hypothetical protein
MPCLLAPPIGNTASSLYDSVLILVRFEAQNGLNQRLGEGRSPVSTMDLVHSTGKIGVSQCPIPLSPPVFVKSKS